MNYKKIISGRVASKGKIEGIAKIINSYSDLKKVLKNDIIVTLQTDINYTPYFNKCKGLITEIGGRYCHASIYSKENFIPCITNVKNAIKKIKNKEKILLDANLNKIYYNGHN